MRRADMTRKGPEYRPCLPVDPTICKTGSISIGRVRPVLRPTPFCYLKNMPLSSLRPDATLTALAMAIVLLSPGLAKADECENLIKMDGLLSKAKQACPFGYYAFRFQQQSQVCGEKKGREAWKQWFSKGASTFDGLTAKMGKEALCNKLLADFPMTVKR